MAPTVKGPESISQLRSIAASSFDSDVERQQALRETHNLISRLETPSETSFRLCLSNPVSLVCIKIALDLKLFQAWLSRENGKPCSIKELQALVPQCDHSLLTRVVRHLVGARLLYVHGQGDNIISHEPLYEMTPYIHGQITNDFAAQTESTMLWSMPMTMSLPKYFEKIGYADPQNASIDPVKDFTGGPSVWEYLQANEDLATIFGRLMKATSALRGNITSYLEDLPLTCERDEDVLLVDIGGSVGHDLVSFRQTFKEARGRLVLQDLPHVIESAPSLASHGIEKMSYDFFTPQPVKGAKAYMLHHILHDWPSSEAKLILETVAAAMEKGVSRLLILEIVIQERDPTLQETSMDWTMIAYGNGMERTEEQWQRLIESSGLRIVNIRRSPVHAVCLIEIEKV